MMQQHLATCWHSSTRQRRYQRLEIALLTTKYRPVASLPDTTTADLQIDLSLVGLACSPDSLSGGELCGDQQSGDPT